MKQEPIEKLREFLSSSKGKHAFMIGLAMGLENRNKEYSLEEDFDRLIDVAWESYKDIAINEIREININAKNNTKK